MDSSLVSARVSQSLDNLGIDTSKKIPEIFGIALTFENRFDIFEKAKEMGWESIPSLHQGAFSRILLKEDKALKIFHDHAYIDYLENFCERENPFFPRILEPIISGKDLSVVVLERLECLRESEIAPILDSCYEISNLTLSDNFEDARWILDNEERFSPIISLLGKKNVEMLLYIGEFAKEFGYDIDITCNNFMMRPSTQEIVLSDPISLHNMPSFTFGKPEEIIHNIRAGNLPQR